MRERGLKSASGIRVRFYTCRSREGAWIEITVETAVPKNAKCRSREGAWIEM